MISPDDSLDRCQHSPGNLSAEDCQWRNWTDLFQTYFVADKVALKKVLLVDVHSAGLHPAVFPGAFVLWASLLVSVNTLAMPGNDIKEFT